MRFVRLDHVGIGGMRARLALGLGGLSRADRIALRQFGFVQLSPTQALAEPAEAGPETTDSLETPDSAETAGSAATPDSAATAGPPGSVDDPGATDDAEAIDPQEEASDPQEGDTPEVDTSA